jgi:hypothetical protein
VHFKSFLIELLAAHLLDEKVVPGDDLHEALLGFFGYIVRTGLQEPISFSDDAPALASASDPVRVFDPVNPSNNVARAINEPRRQELVAVCREAFEALATAQTAPTAATARSYYQHVFGPRFTLPADVAGEPSSPTAEAHVAAKIHADLRQLRLLNGGFSKADEATRARAISLWIDRGLAAVVELVYYDPVSHDRTLTLRYSIERERVSSDDRDPGGVPVARVEGTTFSLRVTGTDEWARMSDDGKARFYQELGGGWGSAEPLSALHGAWSHVDAMYARGKLMVSRTVFSVPE